ncbi:hypothetical protein A2U01_0103117, partial [Trifolium medium]|nr:hypothetical protein [Trifolium medium]
MEVPKIIEVAIHTLQIEKIHTEFWETFWETGEGGS